MNLLVKKIQQLALSSDHKIAIQDEQSYFDYQKLYSEIEQVSQKLTDICGQEQQEKKAVFALLMNNSPAWAVLDLALMSTQQCVVPLPHFFSHKQLLHALNDSHAAYLLLDEAEDNQQLISALTDKVYQTMSFSVANKKISILFLKKPSVTNYTQLDNVCKITYTSGTTDQPKGVLLSEAMIMTKVQVLAQASQANKDDIALSILPLSTLLENIGGLYVPLFCGATVTLLAPEKTGLTGSSQVNTQQMWKMLHHYQVTAFIIIPQLLLLFIHVLKSGQALPKSIRFIAMGGAPVASVLLDYAEQLGIPVFEGYGLSEAGSVVAVNNPDHFKKGSVGRLLPSHQLKIINDNSESSHSNFPEGEVFIKDNLFAGYLGSTSYNANEFYATGDVGYQDDEGYLFITGRKKNIINTSYGRNISPEWLESELEALPEIAQVLIYGHARPYLVALIVLRAPLDKHSCNIDTLMEQFNQHLPDYAQIKKSIVLDKPFSIANEQLTGTGRARRTQIYQHYQVELEQCYPS